MEIKIMPKLYELSDKYYFLLNELDDAETTQDNVEILLSEIEEQFNEKAENIGKLVLSLEADADKIKDEEQRLAQRRKVLENKADWLKYYLKDSMINANLDKVEGTVLTVSLRKSPPSVKVISEDDIPQEYRRVIPESWQPDKKSIIDYFKETGEVIAGVEMITDNKSIQIR